MDRIEVQKGQRLKVIPLVTRAQFLFWDSTYSTFSTKHDHLCQPHKYNQEKIKPEKYLLHLTPPPFFCFDFISFINLQYKLYFLSHLLEIITTIFIYSRIKGKNLLLNSGKTVQVLKNKILQWYLAIMDPGPWKELRKAVVVPTVVKCLKHPKHLLSALFIRLSFR